MSILNSDLSFTRKEAKHLVREAEKIGFKAMPFLVREKELNYDKIQGAICFKHIKSEKMLIIQKFTIKNLGHDIFKDSVADIFFSLLYKDIDDEYYENNYHP